jgi:hypothetical protein
MEWHSTARRMCNSLWAWGESITLG